MSTSTTSDGHLRHFKVHQGQGFVAAMATVQVLTGEIFPCWNSGVYHKLYETQYNVCYANYGESKVHVQEIDVSLFPGHFIQNTNIITSY